MAVPLGIVPHGELQDAAGRMGAEQDTVAPTLPTMLTAPVQVQFHGPEPETAEAVPALHKPDAGALLTVVPFAAPQAPSTPSTSSQ